MTINSHDSQISQLSNENHALVCSVQPTTSCLIDKGLDTIANYPNAVNIISVGLAIAIICWVIKK